MPNAFTRLADASSSSRGSDPNLLTRTVVAEDFRAPEADQFSLELQRELTGNTVFRMGYVGTQGHGLYQTLDGNPRQPYDGAERSARRSQRAASSDCAPTRRIRCYHSLQTGIEKRLSGGLSASAHYTWSKFIDEASDTFNTSSAEVAIAQDSFDLDNDRAVSAYDRPHRLTGERRLRAAVCQVAERIPRTPRGRLDDQRRADAPERRAFTVLNGVDPTGALAGIDALVGNSIRPNLNTDLELSKMTVQELLEAGGRSLFRPLCGLPSPTCAGERVGEVGRNTLRADGIGNLDVAFIKNTRIGEITGCRSASRCSTRPTRATSASPRGAINNANFLNQWGTNGGARTIWGALRFIF